MALYAVCVCRLEKLILKFHWTFHFNSRLNACARKIQRVGESDDTCEISVQIVESMSTLRIAMIDYPYKGPYILGWDAI